MKGLNGDIMTLEIKKIDNTEKFPFLYLLEVKDGTFNDVKESNIQSLLNSLIEEKVESFHDLSQKTKTRIALSSIEFIRKVLS